MPSRPKLRRVLLEEGYRSSLSINPGPVRCIRILGRCFGGWV